MSKPNVLITGTTSGFGKLALRGLIESDFKIFAGVRGGVRRFHEVFGDHFPEVTPIDLHLDQSDSIRRAAAEISTLTGGKLDVLINNAGFGLFGALEDQTETQLRLQMETNFFGPMLLTQALIPLLIAARGRVIQVSSIAGRFVFPFYGPYNASKFALEALSEGLYYDLKPFGVQVCLVEPGGFRTDFNKVKQVAAGSSATSSRFYESTQSFSRFLETAQFRLDDPAKVARLLVRLSTRKRIPIRRPIGKDAWAMVLLARLLPDSWRVALNVFIFKFLLSRKKIT